MAHSLIVATLILFTLHPSLAITLNEDNWSPIVGFEASTNLAPIHFIELDYMQDDVREFTVDPFKVNVGMLSSVHISNLVGSNFLIDYSKMDYKYEFNEISYSGSSMEVSFTFDYEYDEDLLFKHTGSGSFKCNVTYWHFIDKMLSYLGNINHIVTFQTDWQETLQDFKTTDSAHQSVIEKVLTEQMSVRISMGIEHSVNKIVSAILNAKEQGKDRTYKTTIAGLNSIKINEDVNSLATNDTERTMYAFYQGAVSYGDTTVIPSDGPHFYVKQVEEDAGIIFTQQLFQGIGQVVIKEAAQDLVTIDQSAVSSLSFDMTVKSWSSVIKGLDSVLDATTLLQADCSLDVSQIEQFSIKLYGADQSLNSEVPFKCTLETTKKKELVMQATMFISSTAAAQLADRSTLKLVVNSHLAKGMKSELYIGESVDNAALSSRIDEVLKASDTLFNDYFGNGLVVVAEEYLKLETAPKVMIDDGVLIVTWYSREKSIETE